MANLLDMERSLSLLEDATQSRPPFKQPRLSRGMDKTFGNSFYLDVTEMDVQSKIRRLDLDKLSILVSPDEISGIVDHDFSGLYDQFMEAFQTHGSTLNVFDAMLIFIEICSSAIKKKTGRRSDMSQDLDTEVMDLVNERNTWRLMHALYKDRVTSQDPEDISPSSNSEKELVDNLYKNNSHVRECQIIVDWLEQLALDEWLVSDLEPRMGHFTDRTVCWENTLFQLQNTEATVAFRSMQEVVSSLDPDAPAREHRPIHDLDYDDECRLLTQVFREIRTGRLDKAQEACLHAGQAWRAAALEGWRLYHDPNFRSGVQGSKVEPSLGNPQRDIWKRCAWDACEAPSATPLDRAVTAALCGHLEVLRSLCTSWEDSLWAHARVAVDVAVERHLRDHACRTYVPLPDKYWAAGLSIEEILSKVGGCAELAEECGTVHRVVQELLCLDRGGELVARAAHWLSPPHILSSLWVRFLAHLVLIFRLLGVPHSEQHANAVITAYVKVLVQEGKSGLVAYYVSMLDEKDQIEEYALFLEGISDSENRRMYLEMATQMDLNVFQITHRVVQIIWAKCPPQIEDVEGGGLSGTTTENDKKRIDALDWLIFYPGQREDAIWEANRIIRTFIASGKIDAALLTFQKVPDSFDVIMAQYDCVLDEDNCLQCDNLPPKVDASIHEYLCYKAYLMAQEGFSNWFKLYHSKPVKDDDDVTDNEASIFSKNVIQPDKRGTDKLFKEKYDSWRVTVEHVTKSVKAQLYNVLLFPPNGWLMNTAYEEDLQRNAQLESLRCLCIPQITFLLLSVLAKMELYEGCLDLCSVVMSEKNTIYRAFSKQQLRDLMEKVSEACLQLSKTKDIFGIPPAEESQKPLDIHF